MVSLIQLLKFAVEQGASDVHLVCGSSPVLRVDGRVVRIKMETLTKEMTRQLCYSVLNDFQKGKFEEKKELDYELFIFRFSGFRIT